MRSVIGLVAVLALAGAANAQPSRPTVFTGPLSGPTRFADGRKTGRALLAMIRQGMARTIDFDGRFSSSAVACGTGCVSFWFVDRRTGAVLAAPKSTAPDEYTWKVATRPDRDVVRLIVGPMDPDGAKCLSLPFRWTGRAFVTAGRRSPVKCPG